VPSVEKERESWVGVVSLRQPARVQRANLAVSPSVPRLNGAGTPPHGIRYHEAGLDFSKNSDYGP